jgi:nucleoid-associated protein YgaU
MMDGSNIGNRADQLQNIQNAEAAARAHRYQHEQMQPDRDIKQSLTTRDGNLSTDESITKRHPHEHTVLPPQQQQDNIDTAMMGGAALRAIDSKDEGADAKNQKDEQDKKANQRQKYVVREGDTLASIAARQLKDKRFASLIASINENVLPSSLAEDDLLEPKIVIWLPSTNDVKQFQQDLRRSADAKGKLSAEDELQQRFGGNWDGHVSGSMPAHIPESMTGMFGTAVVANAANGKRRENIEKLLGPLTQNVEPGVIQYTVRLGDSLRSIAMKHPALQDVSLWELIAQVNNIDIAGKDAAAIKLSRGSSLRLPTYAEISQFRALRQEERNTRPPISSVRPQRPSGSFPAANSSPAGSSLDIASSMLRAGGFMAGNQPWSPNRLRLPPLMVPRNRRLRMSKYWPKTAGW